MSAFNDTRMLFVTPDSSDTIALSSSGNTSFQRNASFDTSYGGAIWTAYAAQDPLSSQNSSDPTLLYLLNPEGNDSSWLDTQVINTATSQALSLAAPTPTPQTALALPVGSTDPALPATSTIAGRETFGDGLTLTAFKTLPSDQEARFEVSRASADRRQVVSYHSSSLNSTAEPGLDYAAVVGHLVLEQGEFKRRITVPINADRFEQLRQGMLSLDVRELEDLGQSDLHLVVSTQSGTETAGQLLSNFALKTLPDQQTSLLSFRTDTDTPGDTTAAAFTATAPSSTDSSTTSASESGDESSSDSSSSPVATRFVSSAPAASTSSTSSSSSSDSGADLRPASASDTSATFTSEPSPSSAELTVYSRSSADSAVSAPSTRSQTINLSDATAAKETLENPSLPRDNGAVIAGQD